MIRNKVNTPIDHVDVKVYGRDTIASMKILKNAPLNDLMVEYCKSTDIEMDSVIFLFHGRKLCKEDTAISIEMENNDIIEVCKVNDYDIDYVHAHILGLNDSKTGFTFKIMKQTPLKDLMIAACKLVDLQKEDFIFSFNDRAIGDEETASSIGFKNNDIIKAIHKNDKLKTTFTGLQLFSKFDANSVNIPDHVQAKVLGPDNSAIVEFRILRETPLEELMTTFCELIGIQKNEIIFTLNGRSLNDKETASSIGLKNDDFIKTTIKQTTSNYVKHVRN